MRSVGIQECSGDIYDLFASPIQNQTRFFGNNSYLYCFQVLFCCIGKEFFYVFRCDHDSHTLLGFRNSDLCSVQTCVFFRNFIQLYAKSVCQLADGYGYTACTEVVTFFNDIAYFLTAEQSLNLTLCRRITFLNFCAAGVDRLCIVGFG